MVTHTTSKANKEKNTNSIQKLKLIEKFKEAQAHLFAMELTESEKLDLEDQLKTLPEPAVLSEMFLTSMASEAKMKNSTEIDLHPVGEDMIMDCKRGSEEWKTWHRVGLSALQRGECAVVTLAGGQGTRLGSSAPKGCYKLGLPSQSSLFQIQGDRIKKLQELAKMTSPLNWYIMTSAPTHQATVDYFKEQSFFGLLPEQVVFFQQGILPAFDLEGRMLLSSPGKISVAPDGNGGIYKALKREGVLEHMALKGVKYVHMYCVDNCLVKVGDPAFMGACIAKDSDCGAKCVEKTEPSESVGVFALGNGKKLTVAEYSELSAQTAQAVNPSTGRLMFGEANIANHFFTLDFLSRVCDANLPYHVARKKIPSIDPASGNITTTAGVKLEAFIFDVFEHAKRPILFRVPRFEEFAPLKNAPGAPKDSPEYCLKLLFALHGKYLREAGAVLSDGACYELSASLTYEGEGLESFKGVEMPTGDSPKYLQNSSK